MAVSGSSPRGDLSALLAELVAAPDRPPPPDWARALRPGARVGRFELVREIGRGGFGIVFEAVDGELGRRVALKALRPSFRPHDPARDELLRAEAAAIARLQHPSIVTLHDAGRGDAGAYLILELLRGEALAARMARGRLSSASALRIGTAVASALSHAHAHGVLHRDLKPANVFLTVDGAVKVLDFGLALALGTGERRAGGTRGYMAPEQALGAEEDERTDLFALGVLIAEMLTPPRARRAPATEGTARVDPSRAPAVFRALVERLTAPDPGLRPRSAAEVEAALGRIARHLRDCARHPGAPRPASNVAALRELFLADECAARPVFGADCAEGYRRAVALDPTLSVAHYQLAVWARRFGGTVAEQRTAIAMALRHQDGAPPLERQLIQAFAEDLRGRVDAAVALLREATERWPEDHRAFYELADALRHQDELEASLPWLEQTLGRAPEHGWAIGELAEVLGALGRTEELRSWQSRWARSPSHVALHGVSIAHGWLGDAAAAEEAARRAIDLGAGLPAQLDLLGALVAAGRHDDGLTAFGRLSEPGSPVRRLGYYIRAALLAYRGRRRDGWAELERLMAQVPAAASDATCRSVRVDYLLGDRDLASVRAELAALAEIDPRVAAEHAPSLAWLGDVEGAMVLGAAHPQASVGGRATAALLAWRRGDVDGALAQLAALSREAPTGVCAWHPSATWLLGDVAAREGRWSIAAPALERFLGQYVPRMMWRSWAKGWAQVHLARCRLRTGDADGARGLLAALRTERDAPDPGCALAAEAAAVEETAFTRRDA